MMNGITIFGESSFIFTFMSYYFDDKVALGLVRIWKGWGENKMSKDECETFSKEIRMNHFT